MLIISILMLYLDLILLLDIKNKKNVWRVVTWNIRRLYGKEEEVVQKCRVKIKCVSIDLNDEHLIIFSGVAAKAEVIL